jgi:hypothetical protein
MWRNLFLVGLILAIGCGKDDPIQPTETSVITPLKIGNEWLYTGYSSYDDTIFDERLEYRTSAWYRVDGKVSIDEQEWYRIAVRQDDTFSVFQGDPDTIIYFDIDSGNYTIYWTNRQDGLWGRGNAADTPYRMIKYPVKAGDLFTDEWGDWQYEVVSMNEEVAVPAGNFSCVHYISTYIGDYWDFPDDTMHIYYKPNVGFVMQTGHSPAVDDRALYTLRLKSYILK